jgi:DNA-damage-inducible protein D
MANEPDTVSRMFLSFEELCFRHNGADAWRARSLMKGFGYSTWDKGFREVVRRAWEACVAADIDPVGHFLTGDGTQPWTPEGVFREASKNPLGGRPSEDVLLSRKAAYLVAMNGDPRKPEVAFAQHYFAAATRTLEVLQQRMREASRLQARRDLADTEAKFQGVLYERGLTGSAIGTIRSKGDQELFGGQSTAAMKTAWKVPEGRPLCDFAPEVIVIAKQLAAAMTTHNTQAHDLRGEAPISKEHVANNRSIRTGLTDRGIVPELVKPEEDVKKIERRHAADLKALEKPAAKRTRAKD